MEQSPRTNANSGAQAPAAKPAGLHVAIIMDGSGRWAEGRDQPRLAGHRAGARAARRIVEAAPGFGIGTLTLYAFSSANWQRPSHEVEALMGVFRDYFAEIAALYPRAGIRVHVIGRRDRLPADLRAAVEAAETATAESATAEVATAGARMLRLRIALDYSGRHAIVQAARRLAADPRRTAAVEFASFIAEEGEESAPDVDLLIRTGGEQRLSDFLLWECAYSELLFTPVMWPDFTPADLGAAIGEFHGRDRRFGALPGAAAAG